MNIINIEHLSKVFGEKVILNDVSAGVQDDQKIGILGINGTGKSTLLKILTGAEEADDGQIIYKNGLKIAYLPQTPEFGKNETVLSYILDSLPGDPWEIEHRALAMLNQLGIADAGVSTEHLSGGQKKRAALVRTLLLPADVLFFDEPTNHLDQSMVSWLEDYLRSFKGAVILVTHDRYFLDKVTNTIWELDHGQLYTYAANYSRFLELKAEREEMALSTAKKQQNILRMELEWAKRGCRARSTKQKARLDRLEELKNRKGPAADQKVQLDSIETRMGKKTLEFHDVGKQWNGHWFIRNYTHIVLRNERLAFIGPNGCGKSTLLKMAAGLIDPDEGSIEKGITLKIGYFAQETEGLDPNMKVIDCIKEVAEFIPTKEGSISASSLLERFLFTPVMQYTPVEKLSGGERRRLYLCKVLAGAPNLLILDEPSNDLDIPTLTILEDYLTNFNGIVMTVSHDRYFLDNVADRIFAFEEDGHLRQYEGGYTDYTAALRRREETAKEESSPVRTAGDAAADRSPRRQNRPVKLKFTFKEQKEFETIDEDIAALEEEIRSVDQEILQNVSNAGLLMELTEKKEQLQAALDEKMDRWVYLNDLAEKIEAAENS